MHLLHCSLCFYSFSFSSFLPLLFSFLPLLLPLLHPFFFFSNLLICFSFSSFLSFSPFPFLPPKLFCILFLSSSSFSTHSVFLLCLLLPSPALFFCHIFPSRFLSFPFFFSPYHTSLLFFFFFFLEGTACTVCFRGVGDDATDCNLIVIQL